MAGPIKTVVVVIAMDAEAAPFIEKLGLSKDAKQFSPPAACVSYSGKHGATAVHVVCNGKCGIHGVDNVGTVPAALTTFLACQAFKPDLIINAGTAGGFKARGGAIGDVYISTALANHDRRIPLPGFEKYGVGRYEAPAMPKLVAALGLKEGVVTTGNSLDFVDRDMELIKANEGAVKDMEGAAIAWAADLFTIPQISIKSVTDIVDGERATQEEFLENLGAAAKVRHPSPPVNVNQLLENLGAAAKSLQETLPKVLDFVEGKLVADL